MVSSRLTPPVLLLILFFFLGGALSAQEPYFIDYSGRLPRIFQRLEWTADEYTLSFIVVIQIQSEEDGEYRDFDRRSTEENNINISLPPGKYRYSVIPYDLLGRPGNMSEWREMVILQAYRPLIESFYPDTFLMWKGENSQKTLDIKGVNLLEDSEIYLRRDGDLLYPAGRDFHGTGHVTLYFDDETLVPGTYEIYVRNPGRFETTSSEELVVKYRKQFDSYFKLSWLPMFPLYGEFSSFFGSDMQAFGGGISLEMLYAKRETFTGGVEFSLATHILNPASYFDPIFGGYDSYFEEGPSGGGITYLEEKNASWIEFNINLLLRSYFLQKRMALTFRFGFGVSVRNRYGYPETDYEIYDLGGGNTVIMEFVEERYPQYETAPQWNLGLSYMFRIRNNFYMEIGADYVHYHIPDPSGSLKPRLGIGWQF